MNKSKVEEFNKQLLEAEHVEASVKNLHHVVKELRKYHKISSIDINFFDLNKKISELAEANMKIVNKYIQDQEHLANLQKEEDDRQDEEDRREEEKRKRDILRAKKAQKVTEEVQAERPTYKIKLKKKS